MRLYDSTLPPITHTHTQRERATETERQETETDRQTDKENKHFPDFQFFKCELLANVTQKYLMGT